MRLKLFARDFSACFLARIATLAARFIPFCCGIDLVPLCFKDRPSYYMVRSHPQVAKIFNAACRTIGQTINDRLTDRGKEGNFAKINQRQEIDTS